MNTQRIFKNQTYSFVHIIENTHQAIQIDFYLLEDKNRMFNEIEYSNKKLKCITAGPFNIRQEDQFLQEKELGGMIYTVLSVRA